MENNENLNLVKVGSDLVDALSRYLAKDAFGAEFMKNYFASQERQERETQKQHDDLNRLIESSKAMQNDTSKMAENAGMNNERLGTISSTISTLRDSVAKIEAEHKLYVDKFKDLIAEVKKINDQINEIQNISAQTNLLSFNASIEAARAGAAGKGFRVIANEVKKLSGDTTKTSELIKHNVDNLVNSITALEKSTKENSEALEKLAEETQGTLDQFDSVRQKNSANNANVGKVVSFISDTVNGIENVVNCVDRISKMAKDNFDLFGKCASDNEMLFNDLYSFTFGLKSVFADMEKQSVAK